MVRTGSDWVTSSSIIIHNSQLAHFLYYTLDLQFSLTYVSLNLYEVYLKIDALLILTTDKKFKIVYQQIIMGGGGMKNENCFLSQPKMSWDFAVVLD